MGATAPVTHAEDESVATRWQSLVSEATERLRTLAAWCKDRTLYTCRAEALEALLLLSPEDAEARKTLQYVRDARGGWRRDPKYRPVRNQAKGADEFEARRKELRAWFAEAAVPLLEEAATDARRQRAGWLTAALALAPDSEPLRTLNEEVRDPAAPVAVGGAGGAGAEAARWLLAESLRARTRREALRKTGRDAVANAPAPKVGTVEDVDRPGGLEWPTVLRSERVRVLGFAPREELELVTRHIEAVWPVFEAAMGKSPGDDSTETGRYGRGRTLYVFVDAIVAMDWLAEQPKVDKRYIEFVTPLVGNPVPGRAADMVKSQVPELRLESPPRLAVSRSIKRATELTKRQAWIYEGLNIYLTSLVTGTRLIYSVNDVEARYAENRPPIPDHVRRMQDPDADWLELALAMFESPEKPDLFLLPGKDFNQLTRPEVLYAYAVTAWAIEGHAAKALDFFRALAAEGGTDLDAVCFATFGYDARTLEARVHRWLRETTKAR
jgi:hypothetical protein